MFLGVPPANLAIENRKQIYCNFYVFFLCRNRAARVDDYIETLTTIHRNFDLPYPAVNQLTTGPLSPKPWSRHGE